MQLSQQGGNGLLINKRAERIRSTWPSISGARISVSWRIREARSCAYCRSRLPRKPARAIDAPTRLASAPTAAATSDGSLVVRRQPAGRSRPGATPAPMATTISARRSNPPRSSPNAKSAPTVCVHTSSSHRRSRCRIAYHHGCIFKHGSQHPSRRATPQRFGAESPHQPPACHAAAAIAGLQGDPASSKCCSNPE